MGGRVISLGCMAAQLGFVGQPIGGALADRVGEQVALASFGAIPSFVLLIMLLTCSRVLREVGESDSAQGSLEVKNSAPSSN